MQSRRLLYGVVLAAMLAGCASTQSAPTGQFLVEPCVPPTVAPASTWENPASVQTALLGTNGQPVPGKRVSYDTPSGRILVWWVGNEVVAIDPNPADRTVPAYYDTGLATSEGHVIPDGHRSCHWKQLGSLEVRR